jgi:hypothetical protein
MTNLAGYRLIYFTSIHSPLVALVCLGIIALLLLVSGVLYLGLDEKVANLTAPIRAYLLVRSFPKEEQGRAMATWQVLASNDNFGSWSLLVSLLREQQASGAYKPITARQPVSTSEIFG